MSESEPRRDVEIAAARSLLRAAFEAAGLRRLCYDECGLRPLVARQSPASGLDDLIEALLPYCDSREMWPELLAAVERATPAQYERYRDRLDGLRDAVARLDVPLFRNPDFAGRREELDRLHAALGGPAGGIRPAGLTGPGGIGKTQLAVEYVYRYRDSYPGGVFWVDAARPLADGLARAGRRVWPATAGLSPGEQVHAAAAYLAAHDDALLVLDNLADPAELARPVEGDVLLAALPCRLLFTTRRRDLGHLRALELPVLPESPALELLLRAGARRPALDPEHPEHAEARAICALLGYLPLALAIAGAHLACAPGTPLPAYRRELLARGALPVLDDGSAAPARDNLPTRHAAGLAAALAGQWAALGEEARRLLRVAGQQPRAAVLPAARLGLFSGLDDRAADFFGAPLDAVLRGLVDAALVEELRAGQVRLHPMVHEFAAGQTPPAEARAFRVDCAARLAEAWDDLARLEDACAARGVEALTEDLLAALALLEPASPDGGLPGEEAAELAGPSSGRRAQSHEQASGLPAPNLPPIAALSARLRLLLRVLRRDAGILRDWEPGAQPALFAQQMHYRAAALGQADLARAAAGRLDGRGRPWLALGWRAAAESPALERILSGHTNRVKVVAVTPDGWRAVSASGDRTLIVWDLDTGRALHTLAGHKGPVNDVVLVPDSIPGDGRGAVPDETRGSRRAVSASGDRSLMVWDLDTGRALHTLIGHQEAVNAVAVTVDGRRAVSASNDKTLIVWDLETGRLLHTLDRHKGPVNAVALTVDGLRAVSASDDRTLVVWDLHTGRALHTLARHIRPVTAVALTPDGRHAVSASDDKTLFVWDLETGQVLHILFEHKGAVKAVAVTVDNTTSEARGGRRAVSAACDNTLIVWDLEAGRALRTLAGHENRVNAVALTPDGRRAVSASDDGTLVVWDLDTGRALHTLNGPCRSASTVTLARGGRRAVSTAEDNTLIVWELDNGRAPQTASGHQDGVSAIVVTPGPIPAGGKGGRCAVSASGDRTLVVWDLEAGRALHTLAGHKGAVTAVAMAPESIPSEGRAMRRAVSASCDRTLIVWDLEAGRAVHTLAGHQDWVKAVAVTPGGRRAVSASWDTTLIVWDLETGRPLHTLAGHRGAVTAVALAPGIVAGEARRGGVAVSASRDETLIVWDLETGRLLHTLAGHQDWVHAVAVTPDGRQAVSASWDTTLIVWDLETGRALHTLAGHRDTVNAVMVTPGGRRAVSASDDGTLIVWDLEAGRALHALLGHKGPVRAVVPAPAILSGEGSGGMAAVSVSADRALIVWDLETGRGLASVSLESDVTCVDVAPDGASIVAGDAAGNVYELEWRPAGEKEAAAG